jgi:hypothetical protein
MSHAARDHATWSASASDRRWACPGSLALEADAPPDKESPAAAWGTACHEVAEALLTGHPTPQTVSTKGHSFVVDDEMLEAAWEFVNYVERQRDSTTTLLVEQKFSLAALNPPFEAGGTGDAVILKPALREIEIVDLKTGRGHVVEVTGNKQLRTYALGALMANPGPWRKVKATIVQPRAPHPDGRTRSETFDVAELLDWTADLLDAMNEAAYAARALRDDPLAGPVDWEQAFLSPGEHCTFCRAKPTCPALGARALEEAKVFFTPEGVTAPPPPETLDTARIVRILDHADMIENWLNAVRARAQDLAESGIDVTDGHSTYVLVPKQARRKWKGEDPIADLAERTGQDAGDFYAEPKPMSPAQVEKLLGKKGFKAVADLVTKESSGFNLVRSDKTTKAAVLPPPKQFFEQQ